MVGSNIPSHSPQLLIYWSESWETVRAKSINLFIGEEEVDAQTEEVEEEYWEYLSIKKDADVDDVDVALNHFLLRGQMRTTAMKSWSKAEVNPIQI